MSTATTTPASSIHPGMGAIPNDGGVSFRVWAPNADAVFVTGSFCGWDEECYPLALDGDGYWSTDVPDAKPGDEYKFVLDTPSGRLHRNDPYARLVTSSVGNSVIYDDAAYDWQGDAFQMPAWNDVVIYELHVGTFNDQNPDGPGNLRSAIEKLDYVRDLGASAVSVMPLAEFAGDFSWGYNPAFPFAVEGAYGGPDALKEFVREAHARGLAVLVDVVYNHFGPSDLDLWQFDGWSENDKGGIYFYNDHRAETPWGETRPDYGRREVRQFIRDNALMWIESFHADGLRWDGTIFIRHKDFFLTEGNALPDGWTLMQDVNREIQQKHPGKLCIAEDLQRYDAVCVSIDDGGAGFGAQWDAAFVHPVRAALEQMNDADRSMQEVAQAIGHVYCGDPFNRVIYTESHDEVANGRQRLPESIHQGDARSWESQKRSTLGAALVFTSPGIPMIFQGQAMLEGEWFRDTEPLNWERLGEVPGIHQLYRDLAHLRRNLRGTTRGLKGAHVDLFHVNDTAKIIAFRRWMEGGENDETIAVFNFANVAYDAYRIGLPAEGIWRVRFNSDWDGYSSAFGNHRSVDSTAEVQPQDGYSYSGSVSLGPYTAVLLSR